MKPLLLCIFCVSLGYSQTKLIAYKSHSGAAGNFREALRSDVGAVANSNLGEYISYVTKVDSVVYLSEENVLVISHEQPNHKWKGQKIAHNRDTLKVSNLTSNNRIDSIKSALKKFREEPVIDSTKFIGFDKKPNKKSIFLPILSNWNWPRLLMITALIFLSYLTALFIWKTRNVQQAQA